MVLKAVAAGIRMAGRAYERYLTGTMSSRPAVEMRHIHARIGVSVLNVTDSIDNIVFFVESSLSRM